MSKKLSAPLNRLNEEEESESNADNENVLLDENGQPIAIDPKRELSRELALEQAKLRSSIDTVFKSVPYCEPPLFTILIDNDTKRVDYLKQVLVNRLIYNDLINEMRIENDINSTDENSVRKNASQSVAEYANYLSTVFNTKKLNYDTSKINDDKEFLDLAEKCLFLSNLFLNNDSIEGFGLKSVIEENGSRVRDESLETRSKGFGVEERLNFANNLNKITFVCLTKNNLNRLPVSLINPFENLEIIDLSENQFESVDLVNLCRFSKLKEINLSSNLLKHFMPNLVSTGVDTTQASHASFSSLSSKTAENNDEFKSHLEQLAKTLFVSVERLDLSNNTLVSSTSVILSQFKNLKYLNLSNNNYAINSDTPMPWHLMHNELTNLTELNLSRNNKPDAQNVNSQTVQNVRRQSSFSGYSGRGGSISSAGATIKSFNSLVNLRILNLSENNLRNMPRDIRELRFLEELDLSKNTLEFLPSELTELKSLKVLLLSENNIDELNDMFCSYAQFKYSLTKLDLSKNRIRADKFSYKIALFDELKELDLSENLFEQIPCILPKNLEVLKFNQNRIRTLMTKPIATLARNDDEILNILGLSHLIKTKKNAISKSITIDLLNEHLEEEKEKQAKAKESMYDQPDVDRREDFVLPHVFYLRNLKELYLAHNNILEVPHDFSILNTNLRLLDLSFNQISIVGVSLCRGFSNLKTLNLESNRIRDLSDKLRELNELEYLNLKNNKLVSLNYEMCFELKKLKELYLSGNQIDNLPAYSPNKKPPKKSAASEQRKTPGPSGDHQQTRALTPSQASLIASMAKNPNNKQNNRTESSAGGAQTPSKTLYSFNLPNLQKVDLSSNRFRADFSLYNSFALCSELTEIDLSGNMIAFVEISDVNELAENKELADEGSRQEWQAPHHRLNKLATLNLSNNQFSFQKGGFTRMLCMLYKLAPNLHTLLYDQINGSKLGIDLINTGNNTNVNSNINTNNKTVTKPPENPKITTTIDILEPSTADLLSTIDDDLYFDYDEKYDPIWDSLVDENRSNFMSHQDQSLLVNCYDRMLENLRIIDLSNNNLTKLPVFMYKLKNVRQIYFNGNLLKRIPSELYKKPKSLEDEIVFERLKQQQLQKIKEEIKRKRLEMGEEEEEEEEEEEKKKKRKSKKERAREEAEAAAAEEERKKRELEDAMNQKLKLISDSVEVIHLNNNQIEYVPDNIFSSFRRLKEIKLLNNPLRDPPQESVCISAKLTNRNSLNQTGENYSLSTSVSREATSTSIMLIEKPMSAVKTTAATPLIPPISSSLNRESSTMSKTSGTSTISSSSKSSEDKIGLPNLFFETNEYLRPFQSYMTKYKTREDMVLCNMFVLIKDNIDSIETLYKLMRRLKMPMERVEFVCKEISDSVTKNWHKIAEVEYPAEPGKLRPSRREMKIKMKEYILKLQTWNLLNAWRNTFGTEAQSDEIIRIFKLMNSNQFEDQLYKKLVSFKLSSGMLRV